MVTGRKWTPAVAIQQAKAALKHQNIFGQVQQGRGGLGESRPSWHKATPSQHWGLVVVAVHQQKQAMRCAKVVSQSRVGAVDAMGGGWEEKFSWEELCDMKSHRTNFVIRATYDVLPQPVVQRTLFMPLLWISSQLEAHSGGQAWCKAVSWRAEVSFNFPQRPGRHPSTPYLLSHPIP